MIAGGNHTLIHRSMTARAERAGNLEKRWANTQRYYGFAEGRALFFMIPRGRSMIAPTVNPKNCTYCATLYHAEGPHRRVWEAAPYEKNAHFAFVRSHSKGGSL